jgi:uncharacterized protein YndB with AHSA1/START domain
MGDFVATARADVDVSPRRVWTVLTDSLMLGEVMFGSEIVTDWQVGSPIVFRGEWEGRQFEDKGVIDELTEPRRIRMQHYSPLSGLPDEPDNYHHVKFEFEPLGDGSRTRVTITQDGNADQDAAVHSAANWQTMLESLREVAVRG